MKKLYTYFLLTVLLIGVIRNGTYFKNEIGTRAVKCSNQTSIFFKSHFKILPKLFTHCFTFITKQGTTKSSGVLVINCAPKDACIHSPNLLATIQNETFVGGIVVRSTGGIHSAYKFTKIKPPSFN